jgi:two-component system OmpR family sensor kinase
VSLRTRLLLALLGLVAAGLLVAGIATYSSLRSFLLERVDQQLREARGPVAMTLASGQIPGLPGQPGAGQSQPSLPPGTYGELRDAQGTILNKVSFA